MRIGDGLSCRIYVGIILTGALLGLGQGCNHPNPTPDPTLKPRALTVTLRVKNVVIPGGASNMADYDSGKLGEIYTKMRESCPSAVGHIVDAARWPYGRDEGTLLTDNFLISHDPAVYDAEALMVALGVADPALGVPDDIESISWTAVRVTTYLQSIAAHQSQLIEAGVMEGSSYTDIDQYKKTRPVYLLFGHGPADAVTSYYGMGLATARVAIINTSQMSAALSYGWLPASDDRSSAPYTPMSDEEWLMIHVRMHEIFHQLLPYSQYHHDCLVTTRCVGGSFGESQCQYGSVSACLDCWARVRQAFRWQVYPTEI